MLVCPKKITRGIDFECLKKGLLSTGIVSYRLITDYLDNKEKWDYPQKKEGWFKLLGIVALQGVSTIILLKFVPKKGSSVVELICQVVVA